MKKIKKVVIRIANGNFDKRMEARKAIIENEAYAGMVKFSDSTSVEYEEDLERSEKEPKYREFLNSIDVNVVSQIQAFGFEARFEYTEYWEGYEIYKSKDGYPSISCREDDKAIDVIKELLKNNEVVKVHNEYETFYGVGWFNWLMTNIGDLTTAEVLNTWHAWGQCEPYPSDVKLTRK